MKTVMQNISLEYSPNFSKMPTPSKINGFDPLMTMLPEGDFNDLPANIFLDSTKTTIQTILKSYTGFFDIFSESIQNALDACEKKRRNQTNSSYSPKIWISIENNTILRVIDNGCGMSLSEFLLCSRPNMTFKRGQNLKGNKGVGATFLAYGYDYVRFQTKQGAKTYSAVLRQGRLWAEDETGRIERPRFEEIPFDVPELENESSGSCIEIRLSKSQYEKPKDFGWYGATTASQWLDMLRITTPLGLIHFEGDKFLCGVTLTIIGSNGEISSSENKPNGVEYYYPHLIPERKKADLVELREYVNKLEGDLQTKAALTPARFKNLELIWEIWNHKQLLEPSYLKLQLTEEERSLIEQYQICVYGAHVDSVKMFDMVNESIGIHKRALMQGGILLATDGMPQGDMLTIPITKRVGLQKNTQIIVHFRRGNPDMGRKTFQPELTDLAIKIAKRITTIFISYKSYLREDTGEDKRIFHEKEHRDYIKKIENYREQNQLPYKFFKNFTYLCAAQEEQDVIAIFHQLIGCGIIRGLHFYSTEYNEMYDGVFEYNYDNADMLYSKNNPLGVTDRLPIPSSSIPKIVEYKMDFEALLRDFESDNKYYEEIALAVCWRASGNYKDNLTLKPFLVEEEGKSRVIFGSTHLAYMPGAAGISSHKMEIIILEELINFLKNPIQEVSNQKIKYGYI